MVSKIYKMPLGKLMEEYPFTIDLLSGLRLENLDMQLTLPKAMEDIPEEYLEDFGFDRAGFLEHFSTFMEEVKQESGARGKITQLCVIGGRDKYGREENTAFTMTAGEIVSVVGPTGSGKSRLLGDIECLAQGDTPTGRKVLVNGTLPDDAVRFDTGSRLIAQLSQNMNFVMDISVGEFLEIHAQSRMARDSGKIAREIFDCANELAGERFCMDTTVTQLSGGQSRALMIADTALLSDSPIVLIDEIENAGIDRRKAIDLLSRQDKMILMSTHDPVLAMMADKRIIIKDGGMRDIIQSSGSERKNLKFLEIVDAYMMNLRNRLRRGDTLDMDLKKEFERLTDI